MAWTQGWASLLYIVATLWALLLLLLTRGAEARQVTATAWVFLLAFSLLALSIINADDIPKFFARLERSLRVLFVPLVMIVFLSMRGSFERAFNFALLCAACVAGMNWVLLPEGTSLTGAYNSIVLGDFMSYLSCAALTSFYLRRPLDLIKLAHGVATLVFILCSIESGTRGAWLAVLIVIAGLFVFDLSRQSQERGSRASIWFNYLFVTLVALLVSQSERVEGRLLEAIANLSGFRDGTDRDTSVGLRFQMWESAIHMWRENPIFGSGLGDYGFDLHRLMIENPVIISTHFGEAHSLYMEILATTGALGFSGLIFAAFAYPVWVFLRAYRSDPSSSMPIQGLVLVASFGVFGLSQNWLSRSSLSSVYFFLLAFFLAHTLLSMRGIQAKPSN